MTTETIGKQIHYLRGVKAHHIPYEFSDDGWQKNPEHEEEVTLLEYFRNQIAGGIYEEGILFIRPDLTMGKDKVDSFIIIPEY